MHNNNNNKTTYPSIHVFISLDLQFEKKQNGLQHSCPEARFNNNKQKQKQEQQQQKQQQQPKQHGRQWRHTPHTSMTSYTSMAYHNLYKTTFISFLKVDS